MAVGTLGCTERLPERRQIGRVLDHQFGARNIHFSKAFRRDTDDGALAFVEGDDSVGVLSVDDLASPVAHHPALVDVS